MDHAGEQHDCISLVPQPERGPGSVASVKPALSQRCITFDPLIHIYADLGF